MLPEATLKKGSIYVNTLKINIYKYKTDPSDNRSEHVTFKHRNAHTRGNNHLVYDFQATALIWFRSDTAMDYTVQLILKCGTVTNAVNNPVNMQT